MRNNCTVGAVSQYIPSDLESDSPFIACRHGQTLMRCGPATKETTSQYKRVRLFKLTV